VLRFPANIPGTKGHHWADAIAMATPIAHKGSLVGAEATAMTLLDLFTKPSLVADAKKYFKEVQTKDIQYIPFITKDDPPAIHLNKEIQGAFRSQLEKFYYDPSKYGTYLEQLGITYPTIK
jgi:aminobenzoyl-glutamate utilization protein B